MKGGTLEGADQDKFDGGYSSSGSSSRDSLVDLENDYRQVCWPCSPGLS